MFLCVYYKNMNTVDICYNILSYGDDVVWINICSKWKYSWCKCNWKRLFEVVYKGNRVDVVRYLYEIVALKRNDFTSVYEEKLLRVNVDEIDVLKYLFEVVGNVEIFNLYNALLLQNACQHGNLNIIKYWFEVVNPNIRNVVYNSGSCCYWVCVLACCHHRISIVKYLFESIGLDIKHFITGCRCMCQQLRHFDLNIIKYLFEVVRLDKECFMYYDKRLYRHSKQHKLDDIVWYLENIIMI